MENFENLSFTEMIRLRNTLNVRIDREKRDKEVKVGQLYTQYQGDGSKYEHLVIDVYNEYMGEDEGYKEKVKSILYYVRPDGIVHSRGVFNDDADVFVEAVLTDYVKPNTVRQTPIGDCEYAEALYKLEMEFYKKATK